MLRVRKGDGGEVVGVAGVGEDDRAAGLDRAERELDQAGLRSREHGHLAARIERHAVQLEIATRNRFFQRGQTGERRVAVHVAALCAVGQRADDVLGRADLGVAPAEIDERLAVSDGSRCDSPEQPREVLVRKPLDPIRDLAHQPML